MAEAVISLGAGVQSSALLLMAVEGELADFGEPRLTIFADTGWEPAAYVPDDVGLIVVDGRGSRVIKDSPIRRDPEPIVREARPGGPVAFDVTAFARWVSARPDPRHDGLVEEARRRGREIAALHREREARLRQPLVATPQQKGAER